MSDFVNFDNTKSRAESGYSKFISQIKEDAICPFCPKGLAKYGRNPVMKDGKYWALSNNAYPYEGAKYHALFIHKNHITSLAEISPEGWVELKSILDWFIKEKDIPGGAFLLRFGDTRYTGASVQHLHANLVSPDGTDKDRKPILARVG